MRELTRDYSLDIVRPALTEIAEYDMRHIAPELKENPEALQHCILQTIGAVTTPNVIALINNPDAYHQDDDEQIEHEHSAAATLLKYERWTLVQSGTIPQAYHLLGGLATNPRDARFQSELLAEPAAKTQVEFYDNMLGLFRGTAASIVGEQPWMQDAAARFNLLGDRLESLQPLSGLNAVYSDVSKHFPEALNGSALAGNAIGYAELLNTHGNTKNLSADERHEIAHDLVSLGLAGASAHFLDFGNGIAIDQLEDPITQLENGKWIYQRKSKKQVLAELVQKKQAGALTEQAYDDALFDLEQFGNFVVGNSGEHPSPTMKCPVHQPSKTQPHGYLKYELHAALTHAHEAYDLFSRN